MTPFTFINSINEGSRGKDILKECLIEPGEGAIVNSLDKQYVPFIINRGLSYFQDTVLFANAMNERSHLVPKMQYQFLKNVTRPRKRFSKWNKKGDNSADIKMLMEIFSYSAEKARDVLPLFSTTQLEHMREKRNKGGSGGGGGTNVKNKKLKK